MSTEYILDFLQRYANSYKLIDPEYYRECRDILYKVKKITPFPSSQDELMDALKKALIPDTLFEDIFEHPQYLEQSIVENKRLELEEIFKRIFHLTSNQAKKYVVDNNILSIDQVWDGMTTDQKLGYYYYEQSINPIKKAEFIRDEEKISSLIGDLMFPFTVSYKTNNYSMVTKLIIIVGTDASVIPTIEERLRDLVIATFSSDSSEWTGFIRFYPDDNVRYVSIVVVPKNLYAPRVLYQINENNESFRFLRPGIKLTKTSATENGVLINIGDPRQLALYIEPSINYDRESRPLR